MYDREQDSPFRLVLYTVADARLLTGKVDHGLVP
jgi:hypothetical protein